jgi:predicted metalloprotease
MGIGTILIVLVVAWLFGINPLALLGGGDVVSTGPAPQSQTRAPAGAQPGARTGADTEMRDLSLPCSPTPRRPGRRYSRRRARIILSRR